MAIPTLAVQRERARFDPQILGIGLRPILSFIVAQMAAAWKG